MEDLPHPHAATEYCDEFVALCSTLRDAVSGGGGGRIRTRDGDIVASQRLIQGRQCDTFRVTTIKTHHSAFGYS